MKIPFFKITSLLFFLFLTGGLDAQTRFGKIECDSFQVTVDESEAIIYQKNKAAVYNRAKQEFLIKPTKSSIIFFPVDNYYLEVNKIDMMLYNFHCTDSLIPCIEEYAGDSCILFGTMNHNQGNLEQVYLQQDERKFRISKDFDGNVSWNYQRNKKKHTSSIRKSKNQGFTKEVGGKRLNDSLLLVMNYKWDYRDPNDTPIKSLIYPEEDSAFFDPISGFYLATYPGPDPGYEYCGVYNMNTKKWFVDPTKLIDFYSENGFLIEDVVRVPDVNWVDSIKYSFMDFNGNVLFKEKTSFDMTFSSIITAMVSFADTAFALPNFPKDERIHHQYFQIIKDGKMAVVHPAHSFEPICEFKEFVHYNLTYDYFFWLENDSIYAEAYGTKYAVNQAHGIIDISPINDTGSSYDILLIEKQDSARTIVCFDCVYFGRTKSSPKIRLEIIDGNLIINDFDRYVTGDEKAWQEFMNVDSQIANEIYFDESQHASSVWRKEEGVWINKTAYCKTVEKLDFGFILSYQSIYLNWQTLEKVYALETFTLVDNNFNPLEFNGFSIFTNVNITENEIELTTADGSFLIDHQGQLITNKN